MRDVRERRLLVLIGSIFFFSLLIRAFSHNQFSRNATLIDLNKANIEDLMTLPDMGYKTAQRIIMYRKRHGPFQDIEEILKIKGISNKKFQKWRPYLAILKNG